MSVFYIWDILPILGICALIAAFAVKRSRMKKEEDALKETLHSLQSAETGNEDEQK